ncbi:MAG: hypothetical protein C4323_22655 [Mastigocladus sp. ERB_26_2]
MVSPGFFVLIKLSQVVTNPAGLQLLLEDRLLITISAKNSKFSGKASSQVVDTDIDQCDRCLGVNNKKELNFIDR